jgi:hypothetical protein
MTINIYEQVENECSLVDLLRRIAELIEQGYTSGYHPDCELVERPTGQATSEVVD